MTAPRPDARLRVALLNAYGHILPSAVVPDVGLVTTADWVEEHWAVHATSSTPTCSRKFQDLKLALIKTGLVIRGKIQVPPIKYAQHRHTALRPRLRQAGFGN